MQQQCATGTDLSETILQTIDSYVEQNTHIYSNPKFLDKILDNITDLISITLAPVPDFNETELIMLISENIQYYFATIGIPRSYCGSIILKSANEDVITEKLNKLRAIEQPPQKSSEWYKTRHGMLTASSFWQAIDTQAAQNRLIYKKCQQKYYQQSYEYH